MKPEAVMLERRDAQERMAFAVAGRRAAVLKYIHIFQFIVHALGLENEADNTHINAVFGAENSRLGHGRLFWAITGF